MNLLLPPAHALVADWQWLLATWFGTGLVVPLRAGLAVTLAAIVVLLVFKLSKFAVPVLGFAILMAGIYVSTAIDVASGIKDDRRIVIDEVAAFVLGASLLRGFGWAPIAAFGAIFLLLDKLKPWPFHLLENLPSGWGVMADDLGLGLALGLLFYVLLVWKRPLNA